MKKLKILKLSPDSRYLQKLALNQLDRLADMKELPQIEGDNREPSGTEQSKTTPTLYDIEKKINNKDREVLSCLGYPRPNDFFNTNPTRQQVIYDDITHDKNEMGNTIGALKKQKIKQKLKKKNLISIKCNMVC